MRTGRCFEQPTPLQAGSFIMQRTSNSGSLDPGLRMRCIISWSALGAGSMSPLCRSESEYMQKKRRKAKLKRGTCLVVHGPKVWNGTAWRPNLLLVCSMERGEIRTKRLEEESDESTAKAIPEGVSDLHEAHAGLHEISHAEEQRTTQEGP